MQGQRVGAHQNGHWTELTGEDSRRAGNRLRVWDRAKSGDKLSQGGSGGGGESAEG